MSLLLLLAAALGQAETVAMPAFLIGCWEQRTDAGWTEECWTDARGGLMMGSGRAGQGDSVQHWEWMRIEHGADGALAFHASPKGATPVVFRAVETSPDSITFVNAAHDYPQRVHYRRTAVGLDAEISLADGSKPTKWSYRRSGRPEADQPTISSGLKK